MCEFSLPLITDEDISWASSLLKVEFDNPRREALKSMETIDVAACPGSGKTTLLVAKLAILAKKWEHRTCGLCVLSHTNVARQEIESKLGSTAIGKMLLSYPHYIGTIHGFVNEFLTLPLLRNTGFTGIHFSTEISGAKLWRLSDNGTRIKTYLNSSFGNPQDHQPAVSSIHYIGEELDLCLSTNNSSKILKRSNNSNTFLQVCGWKKTVLRDGFAAYDDILAYGHFALKKHPFLTETLRSRFPLVFIDEAQDNSEQQSTIVHSIFTRGSSSVICQRFGDANQAIYRSVNDKGVSTKENKFPTNGFIDLPNSNRFSQKIADLADPLGLTPCGLVGQGQSKPKLGTDTECCKHTIFLFSDDTVDKVFDAYGELLVETFAEADISHKEFKATVVGQVHKPPDEDSGEKFPRHVKHYWENYNPKLTRPSNFIEQVLLGQDDSNKSNSTYRTIEAIAEGILRLAKMGKDGNKISSHQKRHRKILELLKKSDERRVYETLLSSFAVERQAFEKQVWENECKHSVKRIAEGIAGVALNGEDVDAYLAWPLETTEAVSLIGKNRSNIYSHPKDNPKVYIRVGSIHSVKGETHTATLVLETFWHTNNLEKLLPWLCGEKAGCNSTTGIQQQTRLKLHYVAMTRPTHLLCLAMKQSSVAPECKQKLQERGWNIKEVV